MASQTEILALVRIAKLKQSANPKGFLETLLTALYDAGDIAVGKVLVSTSEAGGSVAFNVPAGMSPREMMAHVEEAIEWLEQQPDPVNPNLKPRRIRRLKASFLKANA